jgi:hypothetical protein
VLASPVLHGMAAGPRRVVPHHQPSGAALCRSLGGAPRQDIAGDGTPGPPRDKPEPPLVRRLGAWPHQPALTRQGLGIGIVRGEGQLLQLIRGLGLCPPLVMGLGQPTPPHCVANTQRPRGGDHGALEQLVTPFFFRADAGSGLVIQCVARFHDTRKRRRATRMASSLTSRGVSPWATLTWAASARVHRRVGMPTVRGLWWNSARRDSQVPASKLVAVVGGRDDCGCSAVSPRGWNACSAWRTV